MDMHWLGLARLGKVLPLATRNLSFLSVSSAKCGMLSVLIVMVCLVQGPWNMHAAADHYNETGPE